MKRILNALAWAVLIALLLSACSGADTGSRQSDSDEILIYRLVKYESRRSGEELIRPEKVRADDDSDKLRTMLRYLMDDPESDELESALPAGTGIVSYFMSGSEMLLNMSESYLKLSGMRKTIANYCLALTLCQLDEIDAVTVCVDDEPVSQKLTADDVVLLDAETNPYEKQIKLYFADSGGKFVTPEYHNLTISQDTSLERVVMEELLRGPYNDELKTAMPEGTRLISVQSQDRMCTVDLSEEFYTNRPDTACEERIVIYSIVNSLTSLGTIDSVAILIEGEPCERYVFRSLANPLGRNEAAIGPANSGIGDEEADLVYPLDDDNYVAVPTVISSDKSLSVQQAIVDKLISSECEPCFKNCFMPEDEVISAEARNGECLVVLNREFFAARAEADDPEQAIWVIAATLKRFENIKSVRIACEDGSVSSVGELSLDGDIRLPDNFNIIY